VAAVKKDIQKQELVFHFFFIFTLKCEKPKSGIAIKPSFDGWKHLPSKDGMLVSL
jgi:hypothetical protein